MTSCGENLEHKMANVSSRQSGKDAIAILTALQDLPRERQVTALACAFVLLTNHLQVNPVHTFTYATNMMAFSREHYPEFRAVKDYMENELK